MINKCSTKTEKQKMEKKYGVRYSSVCKLPNFDPVMMHVIDPMHNLLLGTVKYMFTIWVKKDHVAKFQTLKKQVFVRNMEGFLITC